MASPGPSLPFELRGRFQARALLGEGGMGRVVEAFDRRLSRPVAIKLLRGELGNDPVARERFGREARLTAALVHPNVVRIFDHGFAGGQAYAVFELIAGVDLRTTLAREGPLTPARATAIACQVLGALEAAHRLGIVHRDIKPGNVLLEAGDLVKVADFGIARPIEGSRLTGEGTVLGTPGYVAPEQLRGVAPGPGADIYSTAAMLYELIAGRPPYPGTEISDVLAAQSSGSPPALDRLVAGVSPALGRLLSAALSPEPGARPSSAKEFARQLMELTPAAPGEPGPRREAGPAASTAPLRAQRVPSGTEPAATLRKGLELPGRSPAGRASRKLTLAGVGILLLAALAGFSWKRLTSDGRPVPFASSGRPAAISAETPRQLPIVVVFDLQLQRSERMIRLHFKTLPAVACRLVVTGPSGGASMAVDHGPSKLHDLMVPGLEADSAYRCSLEPVLPGERLVSASTLGEVRTRTAGDMRRLERQLVSSLGSTDPGMLVMIHNAVLMPVEDAGEPELADRLLELIDRVPRDVRSSVLHRLQFVVTARHEPRLRRLLIEDRSGSFEGDAIRVRSALCQVATTGTIAALLEFLGTVGPAPLAPQIESVLTVVGYATRHLEGCSETMLRELDGSSRLRRVAAARALSECCAPGLGERLVRSLAEEKDPYVAECLREATSADLPALAAQVRRCLAGDEAEGWRVWRRYAGLLTKDAPAAEACKLLQAGGAGERRAELARLAGIWPGDQGREVLARLLRQGPDREGREAIALGLASRNDAGPLPSLVRLLETEGEKAGAGVWVAVGWMCGLRSAELLARQRARDLFLATLARRGAAGQAIAAWGLGRVGMRADLPRLESLARTASSTVQARALEGLFYLDRERCSAVLTELMKLGALGSARTLAGWRALQALATGPRPREALYVAGKLRAQAIGPQLAAGEWLTVCVAGVPGAFGTDDAGDLLALRHDRQRSRLPSNAGASGIVLETGPLAVEALRDCPAPALTGEGFHVLLTRADKLGARPRP